MKKVISVFLALLMVVSIMPLSVFAEAVDSNNAVAYAEDGYTGTVCSNVQMYEYDNYVYVINENSLYRYSLDFKDSKLLLSNVGSITLFSIYNDVFYLCGSSLIAYDIKTETSQVLSDANYSEIFIYKDKIYFEKHKPGNPEYQIAQYDLATKSEKIIYNSTSYHLSLRAMDNNYIYFSDKNTEATTDYKVDIYRYNADTGVTESSSIAMHYDYDNRDAMWLHYYSVQEMLIADGKIYVTVGCIYGTGQFYSGDVYVADSDAFSFSRINGTFTNTGYGLYYVNKKVYVNSRSDRYAQNFGLVSIDNLSADLLGVSIIADYGNLFLCIADDDIYLYDIVKNTKKLIIDDDDYKELYKDYIEAAKKKNYGYKDEYIKLRCYNLRFDGSTLAFTPWIGLPAGIDSYNFDRVIYNGKMEFISLNPPPFAMNKYIAEVWSGGNNPESVYIDKLVSSNGNFSSQLAEALTANKEFYNSVVGWKTMKLAFSPVETMGELLYLDQAGIYQVLAFDLMKQCLLNEEYKEIVSSDVMEFTEHLIGACGTGSSILAELNLTDIKDLKKAIDSGDVSLTDKYVAIQWKNVNANGELFKSADDFFSVFKFLVNGASTINDLCTKLALYCKALQMTKTQSAVFYEMANNTTVKPLKDALLDIADVAASEKLAQGILSAVSDATIKTGVQINAFLIDELLKVVPYYGVLKMVYDVASAGVNIFLNANGIIDAYYTLMCTADLCRTSKKTISTLKEKYEADTTEINAAAYIESVKMYIKVIGTDLKSGCSFVSAACEEGILNVSENLENDILNLFGYGTETTYDEVCRRIGEINKGVNSMYDWLETSWILNEDYLKEDYPEVYPYYAQQEIMKDVYTPVMTDCKLDKDGKTEILFCYMNMGFVDGVEVEEDISSETTVYNSEDTFVVTVYDEAQKDVFPKVYRARSFFESEEEKVYSNYSDSECVNIELENPHLSMPAFKDILLKNASATTSIAIHDKTNVYYDNIRYHIYRQTGASDFEKIAVIDRSNLYNGYVTIFTDNTADPEIKRTYKVQSEIIFSNGLTKMSTMSNALTFEDKGFGSELDSISLRDSRIPSEDSRPFARMSYRSGNAAGEGITVSWEAAEGVAGYEIYRAATYSDVFKLVGTVTDAESFVDTTVTEGVSYDYCIVAYTEENGERIYSDYSNIERTDYPILRINEDVKELYTDSEYKFTVLSSIVNDTFVWTVSDESIATIDSDGKLTTVNTGEITVTVTNSTGITDSVILNIIPDPEKEHIHTPGEWEVVIEAQVGVEGKEQQKCTVCGELLDEKIIPALPEVNITPGDVNGDGEITASDARIALRISAGLETIESANAVLEVVDINNDGEITASDARTILRKSAGLE